MSILKPHSEPVSFQETPAIELVHVSKVYEGATALADVNLTIRQGEFFCLLGPSGCGKTTLLNIIGGFLEPTAGDLRIGGKSVINVPPYRRQVNTVFQNYALFPHMRVYDNVAFGLRMQKVPEAEVQRRVPEALRLVGLADFGARLSSQLSGGQQQRVALARALVNQPQVLLLDEPLGALDLKLRKQMQRELSRLHRQLGLTFVFVTHDQEEAMAMADRCAVMEKGKVVQVGTPEEIYNAPACRFVADFIGEANLIPVKVTRQNGQAVAIGPGGTPLPCRVRQPAADSGEAVVMIRPEHVVLSLTTAPGALAGTVADRVFLGQFTRVYVETDDGTAIVAVLFNGNGRDAVPEPGQRVAVTWETERGILLTT